MPAEQLPGWLAEWSGIPAWQTMAGLQLAREDLALVAAEDAHRAWLSRICEQLMSTHTPVDAPIRCRLGHWLDGSGRERHDHREEFHNVRAAHTRFHGLLDELIAEHAAQPGVSAARVGELRASYQEMLEATNFLIAVLQFEQQGG